MVDADTAESAERPEAPRSFISRVADIGSVAQASVPAAYAWAVTVAPVAWARGGTTSLRVLALSGLATIGAAILLEGRGRAKAARLVSVWGLVITSALVWSLATPRVDLMRGISGVLGWGLFAYASAAPTFRRSSAEPRFDEADDLRPRATSPSGDRYYVLSAAVCAVALQLVGWGPMVPERALLVRLVTLAASVALVSQMTNVALARHKRGRAAAPSTRRRAVVVALSGVVLVAILGIVVAFVR